MKAVTWTAVRQNSTLSWQDGLAKNRPILYAKSARLARLARRELRDAKHVRRANTIVKLVQLVRTVQLGTTNHENEKRALNVKLAQVAGVSLIPGNLHVKILMTSLLRTSATTVST